MKTVKLYLNYAGFCYAKGSHAVAGDPSAEIKFHALFGLIKHPEKGWVLFDTGYTNRFYSSTKKFPEKIYALLTKVQIEDQDSVAEQLKRAGIAPAEIKHILISHFHADHIAGMKDFPNATFYCTKAAWKQVVKIPNRLGFTKGILKNLIPQDLETRLVFIEDEATQLHDEAFGPIWDIFNDNSIHAFDLPGHAAGQYGILARTDQRKYFLVSDACWDIRAITDNALPSPIVRLFFDSWKDYKTSIVKIRKFKALNPEVELIPTHCNKTVHPLLKGSLLENEI